MKPSTKVYQEYKKNHKEDWFDRHILHIVWIVFGMAIFMVVTGILKLLIFG